MINNIIKDYEFIESDGAVVEFLNKKTNKTEKKLVVQKNLRNKFNNFLLNTKKITDTNLKNFWESQI